MLPSKTYFLKFIHTNNEVELMEFTHYEDALDAFRKHADPMESADIYHEITLLIHDWDIDKEWKIAKISFLRRELK